MSPSSHEIQAELIAAIRGVTERELPPAQTSALVADVVRPYLSKEGLLDDGQRASDPECYCQHVLHVEPGGSFSVVALVWLPGQRTPIHDHVSWCVVGVYEGEEREVQYDVVGQGATRALVPRATVTNPVSSCCGLTPPGDIHQVSSAADHLTISIHVYGADIGRLGSSIRREYDLPVRA